LFIILTFFSTKLYSDHRATHPDIERSINSRKVRAGKGKRRNRRYVQAVGPLLVFKSAGTIPRAFRNIPGLELTDVNYLNILALAPGAHLGRFIIWVDDAFRALDDIFGTHTKLSAVKHGYRLPRPLLTNPNISRVFNAQEIKAVLKPPAKRPNKRAPKKSNPFRNWNTMVRLNPYSAVEYREAVKTHRAITEKNAKIADLKKKGLPVPKDKKIDHTKVRAQHLRNRRKYRALVYDTALNRRRPTVKLTKKERTALALQKATAAKK